MTCDFSSPALESGSRASYPTVVMAAQTRASFDSLGGRTSNPPLLKSSGASAFLALNLLRPRRGRLPANR